MTDCQPIGTFKIKRPSDENIEQNTVRIEASIEKVWNGKINHYMYKINFRRIKNYQWICMRGTDTDI